MLCGDKQNVTAYKQVTFISFDHSQAYSANVQGSKIWDLATIQYYDCLLSLSYNGSWDNKDAHFFSM